MKKLLFVLLFCLTACGTPEKEYIYSTIYPNLPPLESPNILSTNALTWSYPKESEHFGVCLNEEEYKKYIENKEIEKQQRLLYEKFISGVNKERSEWNKLNQSSVQPQNIVK